MRHRLWSRPHRYYALTHTSQQCLPALQLYHLRSSDAARSLSISQNTLKRLSEKVKIGRWPHRKLSSLLTLQDLIQVSADISSPT